MNKTVVSGSYVEFKYCECGCQKTFSKYYISPSGRIRKDRIRTFILGHHAKGKGNPNYGKRGKDASFGDRKHTEEWKRKMSERIKGVNHPFFGKHLPEQHRKNIALANMNERNGCWMGDDVGNKQLHRWVISRFPKSQYCMICNKAPPTDLANITGIYNRELRNWAWFCHKCHMVYDNIPMRVSIILKKKIKERKKLSIPQN